MGSALIYMIVLRILSGSIEITAAGLMYKFNSLEKALAINTLLALVGPTVLIVTTGIGVAGLSEKMSMLKILCLFSGVVLILISLKIK